MLDLLRIEFGPDGESYAIPAPPIDLVKYDRARKQGAPTRRRANTR